MTPNDVALVGGRHVFGCVFARQQRVLNVIYALSLGFLRSRDKTLSQSRDKDMSLGLGLVELVYRRGISRPCIYRPIHIVVTL